MGRSSFGKELVNLYLVIAMLASKLHAVNQRHKNSISRVTKIIEDSAVAENRNSRNPVDNDASKNIRKRWRLITQDKSFRI